VLHIGLLSLLFVSGTEPALRWHFSGEHPLYVRWKSHENVRQKKYGQEILSANELDLLFRLRLLEWNTEGFVLELYVQSYNHHVVGGPEVPGLRAAEGRSVRVTLSHRLEVTTIEGLDDLARAILRTPLPGEATKEQQKQLHDLLAMWLEDTLIPLPQGPVVAGTRWSQKSERDQDFVGHWTREKFFTDQGADLLQGRPVRKLAVTDSITIGGPVPVPAHCPYEDCKGEMKSNEYQGTAWFDAEAGRLVKNEWHYTRRVLCSMRYQGRLYEDEQTHEVIGGLEILDHNPLEPKAPKAPVKDPKLVVAEALAREDAALKRAITNSIGMKLVLIPHGTFVMGSPKTEEGRNYDEDQHEVTITRPFYMGVCEVTRGQFRRFVKATGYQTEAEHGFGGGHGYNPKANSFGFGPGFSWRETGFEQTDDHPVVNVSWNDAVAFCDWLSKKEGKLYRLPTEAEWEYACRAGTTTSRCNGDSQEGLVAVANVGDETVKKQFPSWQTVKGNDGYLFTAPVGHFKPNAFGLYDMHGNALEWCADWYGEYDARAKEDPKGPPHGIHRIARGGCCVDYPNDLRSARRCIFPPYARYATTGLRVLLSVPDKLP
jgi:formylglycine-generating enzyme required for sulfatase activity